MDDMKNKTCAIVIILLLLAGFSTLFLTNKTTSALKTGDENWYWLPSYPNYAPNGMPDFDQKQDDSWENPEGNSIFCLPTAAADVLWWLDSKYEEDQNGTPGDGKDTCSLVKNCNAPSNPNPGPYADDHNFNNVNDNQTPYRIFSKNGELIERLARYYNTRYRVLKGPIFRLIHHLSRDMFILFVGAKKLIKDAGLQDKFKVENLIRPSFSDISKRLQNNEGIILGFNGYVPPPDNYRWGHAVALAGINTKEGKIAISDPWMDVQNVGQDPFDYKLHNDPQYVSHDIYEINFNSPRPYVGSWWIPKYFEEAGGVVVSTAIVISEKN